MRWRRRKRRQPTAVERGGRLEEDRERWRERGEEVGEAEKVGWVGEAKRGG
jgi:hypothetical protein